MKFSLGFVTWTSSDSLSPEQLLGASECQRLFAHPLRCTKLQQRNRFHKSFIMQWKYKTFDKFSALRQFRKQFKSAQTTSPICPKWNVLFKMLIFKQRTRCFQCWKGTKPPDMQLTTVGLFAVRGVGFVEILA